MLQFAGLCVTEVNIEEKFIHSICDPLNLGNVNSSKRKRLVFTMTGWDSSRISNNVVEQLSNYPILYYNHAIPICMDSQEV